MHPSAHLKSALAVRIGALGIALSAMACSRADSERSSQDHSAAQRAPTLQLVAPEIRNENGVTVAHFDSSAFVRTTQFTIDTHPVAVLDTHDVNYDYDVSRITSAYVLRDGSLLTNSRMSSKTIVFDSTGEPQRILAKFGTGKGDVGRLQNLTRTPGDTFIVTDFSNRNINYYTVNGFVRAAPIMSVVDERAFRLAGALHDGTLVMHNAGQLPGQYPNGRSKVDAVLMLINTKGLSGVIADVPDMTIATMRSGWDGQPGRMALHLRLGTQAQIVVWDSLIATGNGESYRISLRNDRGNVVSAINVNVPRRPVTAAMRDADLALRLAEMEYIDGKDGMKGEPLRLRKAWPVADTLPAFAGFFVTPDTTLWVVDARVPGDSVLHATAFNPRWEMIGRLTLAGSGEVIGFGNDRVVVRTAGIDDIGTLRVYRLVPVTGVSAPD
ncbi:MAG: hypothetical protein ACO1Q7_02555 [Gemmatimonas sp.]